jgi:hypothetical protein
MATNTPLQSILLTSSASTIVFSNIDQNYTDLVLVVSAKVDTGLDIWLRCNGDSASNYGYVTFTGNGTTPTSSRTSNVTEGLLADWDGVPKPTFGHVLTFTLNNYSNTTTYKTSLARSNRGDSGVDIVTSTWRNTNAITNLTLRASNGSRTFDAGTTVDLYGIKSGAQKAFGGNTITTDGNYWYHTFTSSGTFSLQQPTSVDYLVVAGGGGGGKGANAGGGGAGGLRSTVTATGGGGSLESALSMAPGSYTVTVGAGGAGGAADTNNGTDGSNSVFASITSTGGGGGGGSGSNSGRAGGSGGGGGLYETVGGAGTANQGYAGGPNIGLAANATKFRAGGGGGAGAVGGGAGAGVGTGGAGVATSISGSSVTYAGGGGGGANDGIAAGGAGGGGAAGSAGTANTGGGGGGAGNSGGNNVSAGGSGIVIVRYAV